jgi:hypothetical protein
MEQNLLHCRVMLEEFSKLCPLSDEYKNYLLHESSVARIPKNSVLHFQNSVPNHAWFIVKGTIRRKVLSPVTLQYETDFFWFERQLAWLESDVWFQRRSDVLIDTVEDSVIITFSFEQGLDIVKRFPCEAGRIKELLTAQYVQRIEEHYRDLKYLDHAQRYEKLLITHGKLFNLLPAQELADFLGMSRNSFARQRKDGMSKVDGMDGMDK